MEDLLVVGSEFLWPGRFHERLHISTRQYARIVRYRVAQCDRDNFSEVLEADPLHDMPDTSGLAVRFIDLRPN